MTAREREDWIAVALEQIEDTALPEIVAFDPELDDVPEDAFYGCAGVLPDFHDPDRDEPKKDSRDVNRQFGRLWPHCDAKAHLVTVVAPVSGARFPMHSGIAPLWAEGLRRMELGIGGPAYLCDPSQCGAFVCRKIAGTEVGSNHSGALAGDINWRQNPFKKGARYSMPEWVWRMWESLGFYWGGRYHDYMHIEFLGSPAKARELIARFVGKSATPAGRPNLKRNSKDRTAIEELQRMLQIKVDGEYGPATEKAVRDFQAKHGLKVDGECGPATWAALLGGELDVNADELYAKIRGDMGHLRNQILSQLGVVDTVHSQSTRTGEEAAAIAPSRRVDIGYSLEVLTGRMTSIDGKLDELIQAVQSISHPPTE